MNRHASLEYLVTVRWTENPEVEVQFLWEAPCECRLVVSRLFWEQEVAGSIPVIRTMLV